ncbi:hypothetical protein H4R99_000234 [Coemansia sp. RSA 1722]|nr:hypothetical protein LPJ57_002285 [Coemansia sp. RSA 486]KAJ2238311.1 hypothetical protein IWW45_000141 [Coemansia sp. RSA 485]KAJ2606600.1 hypothetical protein H4R99_000234 [Coemansia sp. RSA 1722]
MSNPNGSDNNGIGDANDFSSFADFGRADGLDADTMNLFGSFTNDTIQGGIGDLTTTNIDGNVISDAGLGSLTNDLSSFGVDLSALEMTGNGNSNDTSAVDLSSIQLMNIEETPLNVASSMQNVNAADMVARLLGPNSQSAQQQPAAINTLDQQALGLSMGNPATQVVESKPAGGKMVKSRSSSQSSDEMGDIPLAQLALMQPSAAPSMPISQNPSMPASAVQPVFSQTSAQQQPTGQLTANPSTVAAVDNMLSYARAQNTGSVQGQQISMPIQMQMQMPAQQQPPPQQQQQQQQIVAPGMTLGRGEPLARAPVSSDIPAPAVANLQQPVATENGSTGVISTVLIHSPSLSSSQQQPLPPKLQFDLPRPSSTLEDDSLKELEDIEMKLCSLLTTASHAIRMMSGPQDPSQGSEAPEMSESKLKPTIREFMHTAAEVQAGMKHQHRLLATQRIPIHASAGLHSDVAGFERDLVLWSDAAGLLADAIDTGLELSCSSGRSSNSNNSNK